MVNTSNTVKGKDAHSNAVTTKDAYMSRKDQPNQSKGDYMKTRDEIVDALEQRIKQLNNAKDILYDSGLFSQHHMMNTVKEELETLLNWIRD